MAKDFGRSPATRQVGRKVLIACEGTESEPGYFNDLRVSLNLSKERIPIIPSKRSDPLSVVNTAISERENRSEDWSDEEDQCWAVFDGDRADKERKNWASALGLADEKRVLIAVSNPCIELWYLLHFQDQFAYISTDNTLRDLREHIPRYEKASRPFKSHLQPLTEKAIRRARQIAQQARDNHAPLHANPCSGVHALVELLLSFAADR